ncbi:MAG: glycosyl hydrolase family 18 protein, partial [Bacilli bacterium]
MKRLVAVCAAAMLGLGGLQVGVVKGASAKRSVVYYGDWAVWDGEGKFYPGAFPAENFTHLNFAFMDIDANGNLVFADAGAAMDADVGQPGVEWGQPNAGLLTSFVQLRA